MDYPSGRQDRLLWAGSGSRGHALFILLLLVATCFQGRALAHQSKNVKVEVRAKWSGTPILLEAGELVAKESEEAFWLFVDRWLQARQEVSPGTDSECFQLIVNRGISTLGDQLGPLFRLSLMLRSASPKLVLFRQLAQESLTPSPLNSERLEAEAQGHAIDRWAVSRNPLAPQGKCCWVDVGTHLLFDELEISDWLKSLESSSPERNNGAPLFEFDHVFAGSNGPNYVVVLYGALGTVCFERVHPILAEAARQGLVKYVLRPVLPSGCEQAAGRCGNVGAGGFVNLGGYGVELALKNMEYTAIDDTDMRKGDLTDELRDDIGLDGEQAAVGEVNSLNKHLLSPEVVDLAKVPELKDLGFQAVQKILGAPDALRMMQDINHNLPKLVSWLAHVQPNETIRSEIVSNQRLIQAGKNLIAINGALINTDTVDLHSLIELVQGELSIAVKIRKMKVPSLYVRRLLQIPQPSEQSTVRVDFRSVEFVHYLNNLEEDPMYRRWPNNMNQLLMPAYPGQLRYVRKNLYHAVYVVDPASANGLSIVDSMMNHYQNSVPMRFGLIFVAPKVIKSIELNLPLVDILLEAEKDPSSLAIQAFQYLKEHFGVRVAFQFLQNLVSEYEEYPAEEKGVSYKGVRGTFLEILKEHDNPGDDVLKELQSSSYYREVPYKSSLHAHKLGVSRLQPCLLMNGLLYDGTEVEHAALLAMQDELPRIQEGVYYGTINSRTDVLNKFLSDGSFPRYNPQIAGPASKEGNYVSLAEHIAMKHVTLSRLQHIHSPGTEDEVKPITHWLALNLMKTSGWNLLREAVHYLSDGSSKGRVALLYNLEGHPGESMKDTPVNILFAVTTSPSRRGKIVPFLKKFLALKTLQNFAVGKSNEEELVKDALDLAVETGFNADYLRAFLSDLSRLESAKKQMSQEGFLLSTLFGLQPGLDAVITNGKVFVQESGKYFLAHDFRLLEVVNYEKRVKPVELIVSEVEWSGVEPDELTSDFLSTVILAISSTMAARSRSSESARFELLRGDHSAIIKHVNDTDIHVDAVIDPLSPLGQRLTPLLLLLQDWFNPGMRILLNPANGLTDLPLKNFYHYVAPVKEDYMTDGKLTEGPVGQFLNMPPTRTLTMNLDVPEPWLVEPVIAVHDLDNIVLQKLSGKTMSAVFELEALVVTGQCYENGEPPRGLQLLLGTRFAPHMVDTIVMANLGYWQLKAAPGVMTLKLAPGKSTELYTLKGPGEGTEAGPIARQLVIQSFQGAAVRLEVVKRKGKEGQKILDGDDDLDNELTDEVRPRKKGKSKSGLFKWATNFIGMGKESDGHPAPDVVSLGGHRLQRRGETINIFSIASGHLYERFLKIMMLSVLKNTRRPVKFWFIKNYLSPQFKDLIPQMADWYGFEYDLVTYKWPSWLHKQTEKQRLIWAYKILFLDVIFPLSLKKVIFVDADQIVRTDMGELYDMDIEGRPLAYTPFCDNNREMDGYRFWNQGFWRDHLRGRPYHISALYVVDLVRFRQSAAGDKLRVFYESLSKDPHSLSNLDQDLPNYAQHTVPIFSLPQQWLWCESWCGNSTKAQAKTIDLCNNPMTKEPKLEGARRIVDEWPALDEEVREFTARILHGDGVQPPSSPVSSEKPSTDADRDPETAAEL